MGIEVSSVSETTRQGAGALGRCEQPKFVPAPVWTKTMLAALKSGVKGGKWHSLIDKVSRLDTLEMGWAQVERNAGAAGVDRMSVMRFAQARDRYLAELAQALQDRSYLSAARKARVHTQRQGTASARYTGRQRPRGSGGVEAGDRADL